MASLDEPNARSRSPRSLKVPMPVEISLDSGEAAE